ncbi:hypothetical protein Rsub_04420 [Raphidocelis subcapitata]|uniref:Uncharacterized protein n=1 Tax=Raphidocelis subcapitata TaxID=307507 RepID=A0A2V0P2K2_9CHLO|nr:hypothetical protein Rsub_04420 [Raphidocelis subcapitata]|eukprot:GBF92073.1 hypothetical protein Rsub_04420 [Raphidocelis subcapitata]
MATERASGGAVLRFPLPNPSPILHPGARAKWETWREILRGRTPQERALLLREATRGFADPAFQAATLIEGGSEAERRRLAALQERLEAAERNRAARLEAVRLRAASRGAGRAAAAAAALEVQRSLSLEGEVSTPRRLIMERVAQLRADDAAAYGAAPRSPRRSGGSPRLAGSPRKGPRSPARHHAVLRQQQAPGSPGEARRARWLAQLQLAAAAQAETRSPRATAAEQLRRHTSSRRVQRLWREFAAQRKTTRALAAAFVETGVSVLRLGPGGALAPAPAPAAPAAPAPPAGAEPPSPTAGPVFVGGVLGSGQLPAHEAFDTFAAKLQSPRALRAAAALLRRLEARLEARGAGVEGAQLLLRRLFPAAAAAGRRVERYPVRVALVAFMVRAHPEVVFNSVGDVEARLSAAAGSMLGALEALLSKVLEPAAPAEAAAPAAAPAPAAAAAAAAPNTSPLRLGVAAHRARSAGRAPAGGGEHVTLGKLLVAFDDQWLEYLDQFVVWKGRDAASLEAELIGVAAKLERSMRRKLAGRDPDTEAARANADLQAMVAQVRHDHGLLHDRIGRLTGPDGAARLEAALEAVRREVAAEVEEAAGEGEWESASEAGRSRPGSRTGSRAPSRTASLTVPHDAAPAADGAARQPAAAAAPPQPEGPSNEQLVWEMLYNPRFSLPVAEAEAAWARAAGGAAAAAADEQPADDPESLAPEQLAALVARRARAIAERAFWDSVTWRFATAIQGGGLPSQLAPLLSELGLELASLLGGAAGGERAREEAAALEEAYAEPRVLSRLASRTGAQGGGANLSEVIGDIERLGRGALAAAAPARADEAAGPFAEAAAELRAAVGAAGDGAAAAAGGAEGAAAADSAERAAALAQALAPALARALRLTMAQIKLAKLDAANARLAALSAAMRDTGAVTYLRRKLWAARALPEPASAGAGLPRAAVAEALPATAVWVASLGVGQEEGELPALRRALAAAGLELDANAAASAAVAGGLPAAPLRTGLRAPPGAAAAPGADAARDAPRDVFGLLLGAAPDGAAAAAASAAAADGAVRPAVPALASSWRGALRAALVALISRDAPAAGPGLAEVLSHDRERLHALQNGLQQLVVAAAALLISQQLRAASSGGAWPHAARADARRRLMAVLSDPGMKLSDLVTEITRISSDEGAAPTAADEDRVRGMFTSVVDPSSAAFRSIRGALSSALLAHALYGRAALSGDGDAARAAGAALARVGAGPLAGDVAALGERVGLVAGVVEAVWGDALEALLQPRGA